MPSSTVHKAVFVDRDGTINEDRGFVWKIKDFAILPGTLEALRRLTEKNIQIYIITNQSGIALGHYTEADFHTLTQYMLDLFKKHAVLVKEVLFCPHHPEAILPQYRKFCECRKPAPGLLKRVIDRENFRLENLALIGDKNSDIEAGISLGIRAYLVETGYGWKEKERTLAHEVAPDLLHAVEKLLTYWDTLEKRKKN